MSKILLDYFFPITSITPTPQVATGFLKSVLLVVKPKSMVPVEVITQCNNMAAVAALTDNTEAQQLFNAGKDKVYILPVNDLDLSEVVDGSGQFFTIIISSDFNKNDFASVLASGNVTITSYANLLTTAADTVTIADQVFTAQAGAATLGDPTFQAATSNAATASSLIAQINAHTVTKALVTASSGGSGVATITSKIAGDDGNDITLAYADVGTASIGATVSGAKLTGGAGLAFGAFKGVIAVSETDDSFLATQAAIDKRCAFHTTSGNKAKNMCFAFGSLLSNALDWKNQQYISMPFADDVDSIGAANTLFEDRVSFVMTDDEFGNRLGLLAAGGKAIVEPYIIRNIQLDMQSAALSYISGNQPAYTNTQGALLEDELRKVIQRYIDRQWISAGTVAIVLDQGNFVASGSINIAEPKALWRVFAEMSQTL